MAALKGIRVIEMAGLAPAPFAGMILSDFGADVIRIDRPAVDNPDNLGGGKRSVAMNLKHPEAVATLLSMLDKTDVLIEPFRPGVMERLGLGPEVVCARNPRLVYARMTGYGQQGPYASMAGHDIDYIAISGALSLLGRRGEKPYPPLNLLGDFAGGGMLCALGITLALLERSHSGKGQVVDAAMVDGAAYLATFLYHFRAAGMWSDERGTNLLDTGAPFYDTYRTKDGKYVGVGAIEPQFYAALLKGLEIDPATLPNQTDPAHWPETKEKFAALFARKTRDEWCAVFEGTDACVSPVLGIGEVPEHPHNQVRSLLRKNPAGYLQPAPAPRLTRTPGLEPRSLPRVGQHTSEVLSGHGLGKERIKELIEAGAVVQNP